MSRQFQKENHWIRKATMGGGGQFSIEPEDSLAKPAVTKSRYTDIVMVIVGMNT